MKKEEFKSNNFIFIGLVKADHKFKIVLEV